MKEFIFASIILLFLSCFSFAQSANGSGPGNAKNNAANNESRSLEPNRKRESNEPLTILSKPRAPYTAEARKNQVQGVISLRIEFKKNSEIGKVKVIQGLPYGLTEQAIIAAKQIKFLPQREKGKNVSVSKILQFTFNIY